MSGTTISAALTITNIAALRAYSGIIPPVCQVEGWSAGADGGEGSFWYNASDTTSSDNGGTIIVDGAARRWYRLTGGLPYSVKWFGATGNGTSNDSAAINQTFAAAAAAGASVYFPPGSYGVKDTGLGYCILNPGISFSGAGRDQSTIFPLAGTASGANIINVVPPTGNTDFLEMSGVLIFPGATGTVLGAIGIFCNFNGSCAIGQLHIHDLYVQASIGYGIDIENNPSTNPEGNPSNSVIERCVVWDGIKFGSVGDSVTVRNVVSRGTPGSAHSGILALVQTGSGGISSHFIVEECNYDCPGAAIWILNGRNVKLIHNNIESSFGTGSSSNAVIDLDGTSGTIVMPEVKGNGVAIFGTSTARILIRVNAALEADIDNNTLLAGISILDGILLTSNAENTYVGLNEFQTANMGTVINNAGVGTRGVRIPLTLVNGFTNVDSGSALAGYWQSKDGVATLEGLVSCPATPSGLVMCSLPGAIIPPTNRFFPAFALVSSVASPQAVDISAAGLVTYSGSNSATQVSLDGIVYATITGVSGTS
jgi:hypothetical protein